MINSPQYNFLIKCVSSNISFSLIRSSNYWADKGDVDILVNDFKNIDGLLLKMGYLLYKSSSSKKKYIKFDRITGWWVHLDIQNSINFGDILVPPKFIEDIINKSKIDSYGIPRLNSVDLFVINFFHYALNKKNFKKTFINSVETIDLKLFKDKETDYEFLHDKISIYFDFIKKIKLNTISQKKVIELVSKKYQIKNLKSRDYIYKIKYKFIKLANKKNSIVFLGPDGAGKTSLTSIISKLRWPSLRLQYMGPSKEFDSNKFIHKILTKFESISYKYKYKHPVGFISRVFWNIICYLDFLIRFYRHFNFWSKDGIVIFDRFALDMFVRKKTFFNEFFFIKIFPKPKTVFLCIGNSYEINKRKDDLSIEKIEEFIETYKYLFKKYKIPYFIIDTTKNDLQESVHLVVKKLIENNYFLNT